MLEPFTVEGFENLLWRICARATSADPDGWTTENALWGQCAVAALLAQDLFGGELLRASLAGTEFSKMRSHYWNDLPERGPTDFTRSQFCGRYPADLVVEKRTRKYVLSNTDTNRRYRLLIERLKEDMVRQLGES